MLLRLTSPLHFYTLCLWNIFLCRTCLILKVGSNQLASYFLSDIIKVRDLTAIATLLTKVQLFSSCYWTWVWPVSQEEFRFFSAKCTEWYQTGYWIMVFKRRSGVYIQRCWTGWLIRQLTFIKATLSACYLSGGWTFSCDGLVMMLLVIVAAFCH